MANHTIALHLDDVDQARELLGLATQLAEKHNSHLIGMYIMRPLHPYVARISDASLSAEFSAIAKRDQMSRMEQLKELFYDKTQNQSFESEWRFVESDHQTPYDLLLRQASMSDLLILGYDQRAKSNQENKILVEKTLLDSPVPTLLVPRGFHSTTSSSHVMVGWDGRTNSRRAITAAIPFLKKAENAWVHRVAENDNEEHFEYNEEIDLASMLSRHGIRVELSTGANARRVVGESLLSEARLRGADLIVAGAFGHARIHDIVLGSTTEYLLKNTEVPLLMMH